MKKVIYVLVLSLFVLSGLVYANREIKKETPKSAPKPISATDRNAAMKIWETTPDGVRYKIWEASPAGKKVYAAEAKIRKHLNNYTPMEAVVTALSLPTGSKLGFGVMVKIDGEDYILRFDTEKSQLEQLKSLRVNNKIMIKSHYVSHAPKYTFPILSAENVERDGKMIYKRVPPKGGC